MLARIPADELLFEFREGFSNKVKGTYIHATKIGSDNNINIRDFFNKSPKWKEIEHYWYDKYERELIAATNQINVNKNGTLMPCYKLMNGYKENTKRFIMFILI